MDIELPQNSPTSWKTLSDAATLEFKGNWRLTNLKIHLHTPGRQTKRTNKAKKDQWLKVKQNKWDTADELRERRKQSG